MTQFLIFKIPSVVALLICIEMYLFTNQLPYPVAVMPPKKQQGGGKNEQKKKEKVLDDKTFGMKNKKGKKQQQQIQQIKSQVGMFYNFWNYPSVGGHEYSRTPI